MLMEHTRRFVFRGNASAASGRIHRPTDVLIDVDGASSLTVVGGISQSKIPAQSFGPYLRFQGASTLAEGSFDDQKQAVELTQRRMSQDTAPTTTRVSAEVEGLIVGEKPELNVMRVRAALVARSGRVGDETPYELPEDVSFGSIDIGGSGLIVEIDYDAFRQCPTHAALLKAVGDRQFIEQHGGCFFLDRQAVPATPATLARGPALRQSSGTTFATIVKSIRWADKPYPGATIEHHSVIVPDFGTIFFGEILISSFSRRLTMLRLDLGSPVGGFVACAEVENNGIWAP
jgi:hypothetical protein